MYTDIVRSKRMYDVSERESLDKCLIELCKKTHNTVWLNECLLYEFYKHFSNNRYCSKDLELLNFRIF